MEPLPTAWVFVGVGCVAVLAALSTRLSGRSGLPSLLLFLSLGLAVRAQPWVEASPPSPLVIFRVGTAALVLILFDGGLNTPLVAARAVAAGALSLATVGVVVTAGLGALAGLALGLPLPIALLAGAVASSTDAAAVFAALRATQARLRERVSLTLELESGLNDPMAMFLTIVATGMVLGTHELGSETVIVFLQQLAGGVGVGLAAGLGGRRLLAASNLPSAGLYPILTAGLAFGAFGVATAIEGSGFLAVYVAALLLAQGWVPYRSGVRRVHDALAWVSQIAVFFVLGLSIEVGTLASGIVPGAALALALAFVARPLATIVSLPFGYAPRERAFIALAGLRGATPVVLAAYPLLQGVAGADRLFSLVFALVIVNAFLPGALLGRAAARLGLRQARPPPPPAGLEIVSHGEYDGEFISYWVSPASAVAGALVRDLPLPDETLVTLILRGHEAVVPRGETRFLPGDYVLVFARAADRPLADLLFGQHEE